MKSCKTELSVLRKASGHMCNPADHRAIREERPARRENVAIALNVTAAAIAVYLFFILIVHAIGLRRVPKLPRISRPLDEEPLVSVIIAARNEEEAIGRTIDSLARQTYRRLEIIVVNDRSADRTGDIAEQRAGGAFPNIRVVHVETLPEGWLGKNHAMYTGYRHAAGNVLLFTDADVEFHPDAIRSAMGYMRRSGADHISLIPYFVTRSFRLRGFVHFFGATLYLSKPPWRPNDDRQTRDGIGIGAFMLLTRDAYEQIGTHRELKLRPDDDLQLGIRIKRNGLKQRYLIGTGHLCVEWYPSLTAAARGLEKNMFAGIGYSLPALGFVIFAVLLFHVFPYVGVWIPGGWHRAAFAPAILSMLGVYGLYTVRVSNDKPYDLVLLPLFALIYLVVFVRACVLTLARGGIDWRGTFYTLEELRRQR